MASPFPFSSGQVLTAAQLNSIGEATAFTPSWTNFTPGNATESWHYVQVNEWLFFAGQTILGSTSSVTGQIEFDFPVGTQVSLGGTICGQAAYIDLSPLGIFMGHVDQNASKIRFEVMTAGGTYVQRAVIASGTPFTWTTSDIIRASGAVAIS